MKKIIGGYFGLETENLSGNSFLDNDYFFLNSGRNALEFILSGIDKIETIYVPAYTCPVILEPIKRLGINSKFYKIDNNINLDLKILNNLHAHDYIIINNYFGIKDTFIDTLIEKYSEQRDRIIIDGAQSLFYTNKNIKYIFYSLPKFFGSPDGGIAKLANPSQSHQNIYEKLHVSKSYDRCSHLIKRIDLGAEEGYDDFQKNTKTLSELAIGKMSKFTCFLLERTNLKHQKETRKSNFLFLHERLKEINKIKIDINIAGPLTYPLLIDSGAQLKAYLIKNKIFVPTFWPELYNLSSDFKMEKRLTENIVFLPIDQRYSFSDMMIIINKITTFRKS